MRRLVVFNAILIVVLTAAPAAAHPSWDEYKHKQLHDAPQVVALVDADEGLLPEVADTIVDRHRLVQRVRDRWEHIDARYDRRIAAQTEPEPVVAAAPAPAPVVSGDVASIIYSVFGSYGEQAVVVASCESGLDPAAVNGEYLGIFQMGAGERATYGHAADAYTQARAAYDYFVASGSDWSPWACKP